MVTEINNKLLTNNVTLLYSIFNNVNLVKNWIHISIKQK
jgi:hypothetical protein